MAVYHELREELISSHEHKTLSPGAYNIFEKMANDLVNTSMMFRSCSPNEKVIYKKDCFEAAVKFWDRYNVAKESNAQVYFYTVMKSQAASTWKKLRPEMDPLKVYQKNKARLDLRQYTREFMKVKPHSKDAFEAGQAYYVYYPVKESLTDRWHNVAVVYCLGRYIDINGVSRARCVNIMYMPTYEQLRLLQEGYSVLQKSKNVNQLVYGTVTIHEKLQVGQSQCAIKDFTESQVAFCRKIKREDWGMLPLLKKELFGNLSYSGLQESFNAECKKPIVVITKKDKDKEKEKVIDEKLDEDEEDNEDPIDYDAAFDYESPFTKVERISTERWDI